MDEGNGNMSKKKDKNPMDKVFHIKGISNTEAVKRIIDNEVGQIIDCRYCQKLTFGNSLLIRSIPRNMDDTVFILVEFDKNQCCCSRGYGQIQETLSSISNQIESEFVLIQPQQ